MGQKISDGKAVDRVCPAGDFFDYDLYRIGGWNGCVVTDCLAAATARSRAFEADPAAIYSILVPSALNPAVGALLYWDDQTAAVQRGDTDLVVGSLTLADQACFLVTKVKNANGYVQGRVLNGGSTYAAS